MSAVMVKKPIALRAEQDELDQIDARAKAAGLSRNAYMIRSALGELEDPSTISQRLDELEKRVLGLENAS